MTKLLPPLREMSIWALFDSDISLEGYATLKSYARQSARVFDFFHKGMKPEDGDLTRHGKIEELDAWVASPQGQQTLLRLTEDLQGRIRGCGAYALPAHDLRQILYKDATEGLRFAEYEDPQGYKSAFIIPMFCHDIGRLLEGKFYDLDLPMSEWIPHSQLSFLMLQEVLDEYPEIPNRLKNHFLYAVLAHSGENGQTYMSRAVQTCDRMQMIGPEGFFRAVSFMTALLPEGELFYPYQENYQMDLPRLWDHKSVLSVMEHAGRNMYPNIGDNHRDWQENMMCLNTAILWRMAQANPRLRDSMFAPENGVVAETSLGHFKRPFPAAHMMAVRDMLDRSPRFPVKIPGSVEASPEKMYQRLLGIIEVPLGAAPLSAGMKNNLSSAVERVPDNDRACLALGVNCAAAAQRQLDREDDALINRILFTPGASPLSLCVARQAQQYAGTGILLAAHSVPGRVPRYV